MITNRRYYYINSRDRISGTDGDFTVRMDIPAFGGFTHAVVTDCMIPKSYYLVSKGRNTFTLTENGDETVIALPEGNYNYRSFREVLTNLLNGSSTKGWTYDVEVPSINEPATGKFTFMVTGAGINDVSFTFPDNDLYERFGFDRLTTQHFTPTSNPAVWTLTSTNVVKFDLEDTLYLCSNLTHNGTDDCLQQIYVNVQDFASIHFQCPDIHLHMKPLQSAMDNVYRFTLTDEDGHHIDLNGGNIVFTVMLFRYEPLQKSN